MCLKRFLKGIETYLYKSSKVLIMKSIIRWFVPKEEKLFEMLAEQSQNALECTKELKNFVNNYEKFERSERKSQANAIKNIKLKGNELTRKTIEKLIKTSISTVDKHDLHQMAVLLDDITDLITMVALRLVHLSVERIDNRISELLDLILDVVIEVDKSILNLKNLKVMKEHCANISTLNNKAEDVYNEALSELFHFYKNSIDIIKYKEIYEILERITEKCRDAVDIIESIIIKHS